MRVGNNDTQDLDAAFNIDEEYEIEKKEGPSILIFLVDLNQGDEKKKREGVHGVNFVHRSLVLSLN